MVQTSLQALFTVAHRTFNRLGNRSGQHCDGKALSQKAFDAADLEELFDPRPRVETLKEPCAEPEPVSELEPPHEAAPKTSYRAVAAGFALACGLAVLGTCSCVALLSLARPTPVPDCSSPFAPILPSCRKVRPSFAPAVQQPLDSSPADSSLADVAVVASEPQVVASSQEPEQEVPVPVKEAPANNKSAVYTVGLTRHSFPVNKVGDVVYYRSAYFGTVHVGSPAVPFKVVFDTGSGHLILPSTYCQSETCRAHRRYRKGSSSTAKDIDYDGSVVSPGQPRDQITVSFGTGEVTGVFIEDVVCMNGEDQAQAGNASLVPSSGAVAPAGSDVGTGSDLLDRGCVKLRLIAATAMSEEPFKTFQFDGVLGLGLDGLSQAPEFNFLDILASSFDGGNGNTPHTFAVFLAEDAEEESKITFGGWDEEVLMDEDLSWNSVLDPELGHWTIRIKSLRIDNEVLQLCHSGCKGVVDTGTSLLAVPAIAFSELYTLLRHPAPMEGHCHGKGPQLHIELDHFTITLGPEDYSRLEKTPVRKSKPRFEAKPHNVSAQGRTDLHCKPMLMSMDLPEPLGPKLFILGEPVLRKYYSVYDAKEKRVGFSRARHHSVPSSPLPADMTPALKKDPVIAERSTSGQRSMFEVFKWKKLHHYS